MFRSSLKDIKDIIKNIPELLEGKTSKAQMFRGSLGSLLINAGNKLIVLITGVFLVRILGKAEYGIYTYLLSLIHVLIIPVEYGLSNLLVRETAQGMAKQEYPALKGVWRWSFRVSTLLAIAILILSALGAIWAKNYFSQLEMFTFFWAMVLMPFQALVYIGSAALQGLKKVLLGQLADLIIIPGLFAVLFLIFGFLTPVDLTASSAMALRLIATLIGFIFTIIYLILKTPGKVRKAKSIYSGRVWLISALSLGMSGGFNMIKTRLSTLIMGLFVDSGQIGTFQVAVSTAALSGLALHAVNAILAPQFASLIAQNDTKKLQRLVSTSSLIVSAFNLVVTLIFILFGKPLLVLTFGAELVEAYPPLVILLIGQLVNSFAGSVAYLLNMAGYEKDVMKIIGISTVINTVLTLIITPFWGIIGGAIASSVSLIISQIAMHRLVIKKLGIISHAFGKKTS